MVHSYSSVPSSRQWKAEATLKPDGEAQKKDLKGALRLPRPAEKERQGQAAEWEGRGEGREFPGWFHVHSQLWKPCLQAQCCWVEGDMWFWW